MYTHKYIYIHVCIIYICMYESHISCVSKLMPWKWSFSTLHERIPVVQRPCNIWGKGLGWFAPSLRMSSPVERLERCTWLETICCSCEEQLLEKANPLSWGTSASDMLWTRWEYWDLRLHWLIRIGHPCWPAMPLSMKMTKEYRQWTMACETCAFMDDFPIKNPPLIGDVDLAMGQEMRKLRSAGELSVAAVTRGNNESLFVWWLMVRRDANLFHSDSYT